MIDLKTYEHKSFSFDYPASVEIEPLTVDDATRGIYLILRGRGAMIFFYDTLYSGTLERMRLLQAQGRKNVGERKYPFDSRAGYQFRYFFDIDTGGEGLGNIIFTVDDGHLYEVTYAAGPKSPLDVAGEDIGTMEGIVTSWRWK